MPANDDDLSLLADAAQAAGAVASGYFRTGFKTWDKPGGAGPVTEADLEIDAMLRARLCAARPDYGWLSEETPDTADRLDKARTFVVDPIDGTRAFAEGNPSFAVSLAVVEHGRPVAAVVALPERGLTYTAALGQGARLNQTRIATGKRAWLEDADILASATSLSARFWRGAAALPARCHTRPSLAYRLCLVAQGRFDAMLTLRDTWEWDIAAGVLIAQEAGARALDTHGRPLRFNTPKARGPGILVANPMLHAKLAARLKPGFTIPV